MERAELRMVFRYGPPGWAVEDRLTEAASLPGSSGVRLLRPVPITRLLTACMNMSVRLTAARKRRRLVTTIVAFAWAAVAAAQRPAFPSAPILATLPAPQCDSNDTRSVVVAGGGPSAVAPAPVPDTLRPIQPSRLSQWEYMNAGSPRYTLTGDLPYRETNLQAVPLAIFGTGLLGLATSISWYQQAWYPDSTKGPFQFQVDWGYSKQFDKLGHIFGGWMSAYCSHEAAISSGLSKEDAALWGSIGGLVFQTFIEVQDGFHRNYGFDWTDEASNVIGAGYFYAQQKIPALQNFDLKWSVGASGRDSAREASQIRSRLIVDDYDRQNVWVSAKMHYLLPDDLAKYWPRWLQLAVGYGARDVELTGYTAYRTAYVSLDYDLVELLPNMGSFGNWLVQGLNAFHLPAPALQIYPKLEFQLLYPIHL